MRVGLVCPYSLTVPGGVQSQVLGLGRALRRTGIDARVLGPCDGAPPDTAVIPLGNSVPTAVNGSMAAIAPDPAATLRTIRALREEGFDVLHLHEPLVPGPTLTALVVGSDTPLVGTFHRAGYGGWYRVARSFARRGAARLDVRAAVSEQALATARRALGGHYELLWNGIDTGGYERAEPWPAPVPAVCFIGRHEPRKGLSVLIQAFSLMGPDAKLWIVGEGPETASLRQATLGDPRVEWLGVIGEEDKLRRLRGAQAFCAPSVHGESFGVVLLEAMAAGTPVVASDLPGYRCVAGSGDSAAADLIPPGDATALARALSTALAGGPEVARRVVLGRARARELSLGALAERYVELYHKAGAG